MTKLSDASDVTDRNAYALSAVEKNANVDGTLANAIAYSSPYIAIVRHRMAYFQRYLNDMGWYRLFDIRQSPGHTEYTTSWFGIDMTIYRSWNYCEPEYHKVFMAYCAKAKAYAKTYASVSASHLITKLRFVGVNENSNTHIYVDFYYGYDKPNTATILGMICNDYTYPIDASEPVLSDAGGTIIQEVDIPATV